MDEQRIGTNAAVAVQVCEFHEPDRQNDNLAENEDEFARMFFGAQFRGGFMSNGGRMT